MSDRKSESSTDRGTPRGTRPHELLGLTLGGKKVELGSKDAKSEVKSKVTSEKIKDAPPRKLAPQTPKGNQDLALWDRLPRKRASPPKRVSPKSSEKSHAVIPKSRGSPQSSPKSKSASGKSKGSELPATEVQSDNRPISGVGSPIMVYNAPTSEAATEITTLEEEAMEDRRRMRIAIFWILVAMVGMVGYAFYAMDQVRATRRMRHEQKLREAVQMFPRNPYEYNERQRRFYARNFWRRFNIRNIALLCVSTLGSLWVARWHRMRRVMLQRRKTLAFWMWTAGAGLLAVMWGVYAFKQSQTPVVIKAVKRNPYLRAFLYIGTILIIGLGLYVYRLRKRKSKKQAMLDAWRKKKHEQHMQKARDIRYRDMKPLEMKPLSASPGK